MDAHHYFREKAAEAFAAFEDGEYELAAGLYRALWELEPGDPTTAFNLGLSLERLGDDASALEWFERVVDREAGACDAWNEIGLIHFRRNDPARAEEAFRRVLALAPADALALNNLGVLHFIRGELREARGYFELALAADPGQEDARVNLSDTLDMLGEEK